MNDYQLIDIPPNIDNRGYLWQIYGQYPFIVKRIYVVGNFSKDVIRGFHGHHFETKCYFVASGSAKFIAYPFGTEYISEFVLSTKKPQVLRIPPKNMHGWKALEDNTVLIGLSDKTLEESKNDDIREDWDTVGKKVWLVKDR